MSKFQEVIGYREPEKSPFIVVRQTDALLRLFYSGAIHRPGLARDYFHDYTISYLKEAEKGSGALYDGQGNLVPDVDLETREAADHALVVFTHMHDRATSPFLPKGFSKRGMLGAPTTHRQFLARIKELKIGIWQVVEGRVQPYATLEVSPRLLRIFKFFEVGTNLPLKLIESAEK